MLTLQVGPNRTIKTIAAAARAAKPGTTIEVDAGDYGSWFCNHIQNS